MLKSISAMTVAAAVTVSSATALAETNMLLILDGSNSMWGQVDGTAKIDTAKKVLTNLLTDLPPETKLGLMAYGHRSAGDCGDVEMLADIGRESVAGLLGKINAITPKGKTPIAASLARSEAAFADLQEENNHIVLISDGIETCQGDPCAVAAGLIAKGLDVRVHVIGFDVSAEARRQLECIAEAGNGKYFNAQSAQELQQAVIQVAEVTQAKSEPEPAPAEPEIYFFDDFDGEDLAEHWEVFNPNPDAFIVEEGELLAISSDPASFADENIENLFRLIEPMPKGDWVATARFSVDFQTVQERIFFGLYDDKDNYMVGELSTGMGSCYPGGSRSMHLYLTPTKAVRGKVTTGGNEVWSIKRCDKYTFNVGMAQGQPFVLRLEKKGRSYISSIMMEGDEEPKWIEVPGMKLLRSKGNLAIGLYQVKKGEGETSLTVDWVKIEVPG